MEFLGIGVIVSKELNGGDEPLKKPETRLVSPAEIRSLGKCANCGCEEPEYAQMASYVICLECKHLVRDVEIEVGK